MFEKDLWVCKKCLDLECIGLFLHCSSGFMDLPTMAVTVTHVFFSYSACFLLYEFVLYVSSVCFGH